MLKAEATKSVVQAAWPWSVAISTLAGLTLQQWVLLATLVYTVVHTVILLPKAISCVVCFFRNGWSCERKCACAPGEVVEENVHTSHIAEE